MPISASKFKTSTLNMKLKAKGPIIIPAIMYPITIGCFSLYDISDITAATIIIIAKSCIICPISITNFPHSYH
jgi:hypothetical protein